MKSHERKVDSKDKSTRRDLYYVSITFGFIHRKGVLLVSDESSYFSHHPSKFYVQ